MLDHRNRFDAKSIC